MIFWCLLLRQRSPLQEKTASSDKSIVHRNTDCAGEINSGERMFAGGEGVVRGHTPAKPQWSEVIVFSDVLLRQSTPLQEETASSDEQDAHRKWGCASEINSCERMLAGGGCVVGG